MLTNEKKFCEEDLNKPLELVLFGIYSIGMSIDIAVGSKIKVTD